ncbi:hypothetical protein J2W69_003778 [Rheinheimera soli]|jgi:hypothetical protein|uniref:Uncharacterized protein n=1 Tax=Rheinheimera soli TaxID=443616 RepID=A0ABU1W4R7_9GAMM|nr:hypothetical protein [Rheinheimera soli]
MSLLGALFFVKLTQYYKSSRLEMNVVPEVNQLQRYLKQQGKSLRINL